MTSRSAWITLRRRGLLAVVLAGLVLMGTHSLRPVAAQEAEPPHREMELQRYRDAVRRHFVLKQYEELLELTEQYGHLYPEDKGTEFYRTQAEIRIQEAEKEIPFERLEDREFRIPGADAGQPSLLDELRNGSGSESGASGTAGLTVEPGGDSQVAMGTAPTEETQSPFERPAPLEDGEDTTAGELDFTTPEPVADPQRAPAREATTPESPSPALPPRPEQAGGVEEAASDSEGSPLLLILGGSVLVLGAVAAFLLIGMARRGRRDEAVAEAAPVTAGPEPAAPPLFNFDDAEASDEGGPSDFDAFGTHEPFADTGTVDAAGAAEAGSSEPASVFDEAPAGENEPPAALGETRGTEEVNQEISDLLFAPNESGEDSVFGSGSEAPPEPPPPLGETQTEQTAFGASGDDISDLVQIPDDSSGLEPASDVDALFADVSSPEQESEPKPAEPTPSAKAPSEPSDETSVNDLSSIDLFGEEPSSPPEEASGQAEAEGEPNESEATSNVPLDEVDALITESGGGSSSGEVDFTEEASDENAGAAEGVEIPFAMEDPFTNLSGSSEASEASPPDDETAFNTSTAETMAAHGADTGVEERELLEVIEEGDGETRAGGEGAPAENVGDDIWSGLDTGAGHSETPEQEPAPRDEVQSFREDETAAFDIEMGDETGQAPVAEPEPQVANPEAETVVPAGREGTSPGALPDDPFDRERQRGHQALEAEDWNKAVYHLSIAASLKPEANDVREELRRARKMKKEQQTG